MNEYLDYLKKKAADFNIELNDDQLEQFKIYWNLLYEYNSHTNLVASAEAEDVFVKHFADSLAVGLVKDQINWNNKPKMIDIGIGGGFPGMPILIANPDATMYAVDSIGKKLKFLEIVSQELGIADRVEILNARAEEIAFDKDKREKFDIALTRAVAQLNVINEYCLPFVKKDGYFVAYKAKNIETEINEAKKSLSVLGGKVEKTIPYELVEDQDFERNIILIRKTKNTPPQYPRKTGIPKKNPLS